MSFGGTLQPAQPEEEVHIFELPLSIKSYENELFFVTNGIV
jgi:hypothetical protein